MARILVIEDNETNMKLAVRMLEHAAHAVLQAANAADGLRIARDEDVDLVLMDIHLPGLDGISAMRMLRSDAATAAIRIVALTAMAMRGDRERLLKEGFDAYIAKPLRYHTFVETIDELLASPESGKGAGSPAPPAGNASRSGDDER